MVDIEVLKNKIMNLMTDEDFEQKYNTKDENGRRVKEEKYNTIQTILLMIEEMEK